ncbi:hypothetical protein [Neobacillus soli]|uniref:hypothetical protein n=1 Tax=Neobacillus soli TaxID=220688 RepID=UPI00082639A7|nr:hypothetical protein [Neobacillus soli]
MRWFFAIPFIFLGAFLWSLTIDQMGIKGHIIMKIIGFGCFILASVFVRGKKKTINYFKQTGEILQ